MAGRAKTFDVWFVAANTVYRAVPFEVVTDWAQQGRIAADDKLRPAGVDGPWSRVGDDDLVADYLFAGPAAGSAPAAVAEELEPVEMDVGWRKRREDEDDDVDMIPLIDISLVLLIFFMMTTAVAALSPVNVPEMKHAAELKKEQAITVHIDKTAAGGVYYALRVGDGPPEKADDELPNLDDLLIRLKARLDQMIPAGGPVEVRIACHRDLPTERVTMLARELTKLKAAGLVYSFGAEVNERSR